MLPKSQSHRRGALKAGGIQTSPSLPKLLEGPEQSLNVFCVQERGTCYLQMCDEMRLLPSPHMFDSLDAVQSIIGSRAEGIYST